MDGLLPSGEITLMNDILRISPLKIFQVSFKGTGLQSKQMCKWVLKMKKMKKLQVRLMCHVRGIAKHDTKLLHQHRTKLSSPFVSNANVKNAITSTCDNTSTPNRKFHLVRDPVYCCAVLCTTLSCCVVVCCLYCCVVLCCEYCGDMLCILPCCNLYAEALCCVYCCAFLLFYVHLVVLCLLPCCVAFCCAYCCAFFVVLCALSCVVFTALLCCVVLCILLCCVYCCVVLCFIVLCFVMGCVVLRCVGSCFVMCPLLC